MLRQMERRRVMARLRIRGILQRHWRIRAACNPRTQFSCAAERTKASSSARLQEGAGHLIVVRGLPTERAIIDGSLEVRGQYTEYWGLEVMNSDPDRDSDQPGPSPSDYARPVGVVVHGPGTKLINMVVHDARSGIGCWSTAVDAEIYGTIVYNNGWQGPDDGYGAGIMSQNKEGTKTFADNVVFQQYKGGLEVYGSSDADLVGFHLDGNVAFFERHAQHASVGLGHFCWWRQEGGPHRCQQQLHLSSRRSFERALRL